MSRLVEAQAVAYLGNVPVGVAQQGLCFSYQALCYDLRSGFLRSFLQRPVQVDGEAAPGMGPEQRGESHGVGDDGGGEDRAAAWAE